MKKNVVGSFTSSFEAVRAIESMKEDGIDPRFITVVARDLNDSELIQDQTGAEAKFDISPEYSREERDERNLWDTLRSFFAVKDDYAGYDEHLRDLGMTDSDVGRYSGEVDAGKILVLVDSEEDVGRTGRINRDIMPERQDLEPEVSREAARETAAAVSGHPEEEVVADDRNLNTLKEDLRQEQRFQEALDERDSSYGSPSMEAAQQPPGTYREREYEEEDDLFYKNHSQKQGDRRPDNDYGNNLDGPRS